MAARETAQKIAELLKMLAPLTPTDADDAALGLIAFNLESDEAWDYIDRFIAALGLSEARVMAPTLASLDGAGLPIWLSVFIKLLLALFTARVEELESVPTENSSA